LIIAVAEPDPAHPVRVRRAPVSVSTVNPSLTAIANALRFGDHIAARLG
jgi:hypothetical protein